ncbi:MOB-like protein phocein isoform X3 [Anomalospiza imberbis]|uniref:MOB-like protein phocein isoform X3 n=1 Tax=Anomalospiza imberbis TaxID=187417 RepID=UPI0035900BB7
METAFFRLFQRGDLTGLYGRLSPLLLGGELTDFYNWPDESFEEMDSTLAVQQYIQQNIRADCSNIDKILEPPEGQDEGVWKYEHLRQFCLELNGLAVKLQSECHPDTCTQMTATEQWIFLCAAHKTPKECPAIDYTRHTLDGAACLLNSNKYFPSRCCTSNSFNRTAPKPSRSQCQPTVRHGNHRRQRQGTEWAGHIRENSLHKTKLYFSRNSV